MSANFRILLAVKLAFLDDNLILFVSRTPDAVTDDAVGLRELPDNPVLTTYLTARLYGRTQPNRFADFELAHPYAPLKSTQRIYLVRSTSVTGNPRTLRRYRFVPIPDSCAAANGTVIR
jgi:hypothetical protein